MVKIGVVATILLVVTSIVNYLMDNLVTRILFLFAWFFVFIILIKHVKEVIKWIRQ